ncbi:hypothetical protein B0H66DRAFT_231164 [Apodospora peruviana]|uniref:Basic proline-rich protein n=1 Tax=Apodospora peruviana TaxID=516989 RepID=A0AAE0I501_9PEZI|nr:hypothetical protein B0H66DRAFT_231164 [Apodospora peruviana]
MRTTSLLVAAFVATTVVASQEPDRPKIYFPRHVKRVFSNVTITSNTPSSTPLEPSTTTTERQTLGDLLGSITDPKFSKSETRDEGPSSDGEPARVTTVVVQSTIFVSPAAPTLSANSTSSGTSSDSSPAGSDAATTSSDPTTAKSDPTTAKEDPTTAKEDPRTSKTDPTTSKSEDDGSTGASSGGIPPVIVLPTTTSSTDDATTDPTPSKSLVDTDSPTAGKPTKDPESDVVPTTLPNTTGATANTTSTTTDLLKDTDSPAVSVFPTTTTSTTSGILLAPSGIVTPTTTTTPGLPDVVSIISSIFEPPKPGNETEATTTTTTPLPATDSPTSEPPTVTTTSLPGTGVTIIVPPVTEDTTTTSSTTTPPPPVSTGEGETTEPLPESTNVIPPPVGGDNSTTTSPPVGPPTDPPIPPSGNTTTVDVPPSTTTTLPPTDSPVTDPPVPPTSLPTSIPTGGVVTNNTAITNGTVITDSPTSLPTSLPTVIIPPITTSESSSTDNMVTSIPSAGITTNTQPWLPTTIVMDPTTTSISGIVAPTSASGIPTALPKAITPDSGLEPPPDDTTLIQIGFKGALNYPFVVENNKAAAQIFRLLPEALGYAGRFGSDKCRMMKLIPLDTSISLGYITTIAILSYPSQMVDNLSMDIKIPSSSLYNNPDQLVYNLTMQINPGIDIVLGSYPGDGAEPGYGGGVPGESPAESPNSDPYGGGDSSNTQSSAQKGATAGIVSGAVVVAAAYGAAMFVIARRYKSKKQAHRRASSISTPSDMRQTSSPRGSPALMGGALLSRDFTSTYGGAYGGVAPGGRDSHGSGRSGMNNSGRTAYISAPVAAENSLGWN